MCDSPTVTHFSETELSEIHRSARALPGDWTIFPHADESGELTLLLAPARWEEEGAALVLQRDAAGIAVLLSDGDDVSFEGSAPDAPVAMAMLWRRACLRSPELAGLERAAGG